MAEQFLHGPDVVAAFEKMRGKGMAKRMGGRETLPLTARSVKKASTSGAPI